MKPYFIGILVYILALPVLGISMVIIYRHYPYLRYSTWFSKDLLDNFLCIFRFFLIGYIIANSIKGKNAIATALRFSIIFSIFDFCVYVFELLTHTNVMFLGGAGDPIWYMMILACLNILGCYLGAKLYLRKI
ncbi:hypothetical protein K2P97_13560 [bacterium]|nr:hypothetical protein [bacterium]